MTADVFLQIMQFATATVVFATACVGLPVLFKKPEALMIQFRNGKGQPMPSGKGRGSNTGKDRTVFQRPSDKKWVEKRNDASKGSVHDKQGDAARIAKERLEKSGGGELTIKGRDGKIRSKDTIAPGNDPNPPKDKEH